LASEMTEWHQDNAKHMKRLHDSTEKMDRLQQENRQLVEKLEELKQKVVQLENEKTLGQETLDREKYKASQAMLEMERLVTKNKNEIERLQDLILIMGAK